MSDTSSAGTQPAATQAPPAPPPTSTPNAARATPQNIRDLASLIMSEASVGNETERQAVGSTVLSRMQRNGTTNVRDVWGAYAHSQEPTPEITRLAEDLLQGHVPDPTNGATHYYSPRSMPDENAAADALRHVDTGGGLEQVTGLPRRTYRPGWSAIWAEITVTGVRQTRYRFYQAPGTGPVR